MKTLQILETCTSIWEPGCSPRSTASRGRAERPRPPGHDGGSVLAVSHDARLTASADREVRLAHGRIAPVGTAPRPAAD